MILEVQKRDNQYVLSHFPKDKEHYYIKIEERNISLYNDKRKHKENDKFYKNAIEVLQKLLKNNPTNTFIKRKIKALTVRNDSTIKMTDNEALYLALSDKYEL